MVARTCRPVTLPQATQKAKDDFKRVTGRDVRFGIHLTSGQVMPQPLVNTQQLGGGSDMILAMQYMQGGMTEDALRTNAQLVLRPKRVSGVADVELNPKSTAIPGLGAAEERYESVFDIYLENALVHDNLQAVGRATASQIADARKAHLRYAVSDAVDQKGIPTGPEMNAAAKANLFWLGMIKEGIMISPARVLSAGTMDAMGNSWFQIIGGHGGTALNTLDPRKWVAMAKHTMRGDEVNHIAKSMYDELGLTIHPTVFDEVAARDLYDITKETNIYQAFSLGGRFKLGGTASRAFASKWGRAVRHGIDQNARLGVLGHAFQREYTMKRVELFEYLRGTHGDDIAQGIIDDLADNKLISAKRLRQALIDNGIDEYDDVAKGWTKTLSDIDKAATAEVNRVHFKGQMTKADEKLRHVMLFHFWQSRAMIYYPKTVLSNPYLLHNHIQFYEALDKEAEKQGAGNPMNMYFKYMKSDEGWFAQIDPLSYLIPYTMIRDWSIEFGSESEFDKWTRRFSTFVHPGIGAALSIIGVSGDFPTLLPNATRGAIVSVHNFMRNHGVDPLGLGPGISQDPIAWAEKKVMNSINNLLNDKTNGFVQDVEPFDVAQSDRVIVNDIIIANAEEDFGMTYSEMLVNTDRQYIDAVTQAQIAIMTGAPNERAEEALAEWSTYDQAVNSVVRAVVPGYIPIRSGVSTSRKELAQAAYNGEASPEIDNAMEITSAVNAGSPESLTLEVEKAQLDSVGTERENVLYNGFNEIAYNKALDPMGYVEIAGKVYRGYEMNAMSKENRLKLAQAWLLDNGSSPAWLDGYKAKREEVRASSDELPGYKAYQDMAGDYEGGETYKYERTLDPVYQGGGIRAWREDLAGGDPAMTNPNFARAMEEERKKLQDRGVTGEELEQSLDMWAIGPQGYNAYRGEKAKLNSPDPIDLRLPATKIPPTPAQPAATEGSTGGTTSTTTSGTTTDKPKKMPKWQVELVNDLTAYDAAVKEFEAQYGSVGNYRFNPQVLEKYLPEMSDNMKQYYAWAEEQPPGSNTSVESYLAMRDAEYEAKKVTDKAAADQAAATLGDVPTENKTAKQLLDEIEASK